MKRFFLLGCILLAGSAAYAQHAPHWTYSGEHGPANWAKLAPEFSACVGKNQSPINLTDFVEADLEPISFAYKVGGNEILNNGHAVQINYAEGSSITVDGTKFDLKQFHFHSPSENQINGKSFPLETHLVHADKNGNLAVVAVMFDEGKENRTLAAAWSKMPKKAGDKNTLAAPVAVEGVLPANRDYYRFNGSLTTPPCSEGVHWYVMKTPVTASKEQIKAFTDVMQHPNNRPLQPVNARAILK